MGEWVLEQEGCRDEGNVPWVNCGPLTEDARDREPERVSEGVELGIERRSLDDEKDRGHGEEGGQGGGPDRSLHRFHEGKGPRHFHLWLFYHNTYSKLHIRLRKVDNGFTRCCDR